MECLGQNLQQLVALSNTVVGLTRENESVSAQVVEQHTVN